MRDSIRREASGTTRHLYGIFCINDCIAVGDSGTVLHRTGTTWGTSWAGTHHALRSVYFHGDSAFLAGDSGTILKKQGNAWNRMPSGVGEDLHFIRFQYNYLSGTNPNRYDTGFAVGKGGVILKSTNRGASWVKLTSGTTRNLYSLHFRENTGVGFVVGDSGLILRTTDRGGTWTPIPSGTVSPLHSVSFSSATSGIIAGANGLVLTTTDAGLGWNTENTGITTDLFGAIAGMAVGANGIILEPDSPGGTGIAPVRNHRPGVRPTRFFDLLGRRVEPVREGARVPAAPVLPPKE